MSITPEVRDFILSLPGKSFRVKCWQCKEWMTITPLDKWPLKCDKCEAKLAP